MLNQLTREQFATQHPSEFEQFTQQIILFYTEDGVIELDNTLLQTALNSAKYGEFSSTPYTYWDDPQSPHPAHSDAVAIYDNSLDIQQIYKYMECIYKLLF